ncbi:transcription factor bHLH68-like [Prosopis cineraria]|uniref:transcription factor bHLH68-like n=1 Tax=Prosopis cineraria TaxID=364024 RepID=UPI002410B069|nr:transcription factor bHLH68-like [Prosopis cineraria]
MNRGHLLHQSSPVQQMMANPNWWNININTMRPQQPSPFLSSPSNFLPNQHLPSWQHDLNNQHHFPDSWTQLLMGGSMAEEDRGGMGQFQAPNAALVDIKQESSVNSYGYGHGNSEEFQAVKPTGWPHQIVVPASSPKSCVTSFSSNMLDFSNNQADAKPSLPDPSSECNSSATTGGAAKKARVQGSGAQSTFKVRKEKLGDRITALHQLVSPFGKTDTASVLLEAIGYIRFLQSQIEVLSLPYLGSATSSSLRHQQSAVQGENNCIFPEDPGQLLNENSLKRKAPCSNPQESKEEGKKDLRSRGLCLVPVSCTMQVGSDNGADYWAPALGAGFR